MSSYLIALPVLLLLLQLPGADAVEVPAGQSLPLPTGDGGAAEAVVLLAATASWEAAGSSTGPEQQQRQQQLLLKSQPFSLDSDSEASSGSRSTHLLLVHEPPAPAAAAARGLASFWGGGSSTPAEASSSGSRGRVECRLAARVQVQEHPAANGAAAATAVSVTITAGCFVSNLSGLPLAMLAEGAAADSVLAAGHPGSTQLEQPALSPENSAGSLPSPRSPPSASSARQGVPLPHASTLPLLHLWQADGSSGKQQRRRHQRQGSWGSFSGGLLPSPSTQQLQVAAAGAAAAGGPALRFAIAAAAAAAPPTGDDELPTPQPRLEQELQAAAPAPALGSWSAALPPFTPAGRQRLYLQQPTAAGGASAGVVMLTYRVLLTGGSFHLVLFRCAVLALPGTPLC